MLLRLRIGLNDRVLVRIFILVAMQQATQQAALLLLVVLVMLLLMLMVRLLKLLLVSVMLLLKRLALPLKLPLLLLPLVRNLLLTSLVVRKRSRSGANRAGACDDARVAMTVVLRVVPAVVLVLVEEPKETTALLLVVMVSRIVRANGGSRRGRRDSNVVDWLVHTSGTSRPIGCTRSVSVTGLVVCNCSRSGTSTYDARSSEGSRVAMMVMCGVVLDVVVVLVFMEEPKKTAALFLLVVVSRIVGMDALTVR